MHLLRALRVVERPWFRNGEIIPPLVRGTGPAGLPRLERQYFLFGEPIRTEPFAGRLGTDVPGTAAYPGPRSAESGCARRRQAGRGRRSPRLGTDATGATSRGRTDRAFLARTTKRQPCRLSSNELPPRIRAGVKSKGAWRSSAGGAGRGLRAPSAKIRRRSRKISSKSWDRGPVGDHPLLL